MKSEKIAAKNEQHIENELDIYILCKALWVGKTWIMGIACLFVAAALGYSILVKPEWSTTAITDQPTVNMLGGYYLQQQQLRNLDVDGATQSARMLATAVISEVYAEFISQLSAYDTRREFWLQSSYYLKFQSGDAKADSVFLDELIEKIQFFPRDDKKILNDSIKLTAETAEDANMLLRQYIAFAEEKTKKHLNTELQVFWDARVRTLQTQLKQQESVALLSHQREIDGLSKALKIAQQQNIIQPRLSVSAVDLPESELFLLGKQVLEVRLDELQTAGPTLTEEYNRDKAALQLLETSSKLDQQFHAYRYLRTPEEPSKKDSPRRVFLVVLWGTVGMLVGAGVALVRRVRRQSP